MKQQSYKTPHVDPRPTEELIRLALSERDEDMAWEYVTALQFRGDGEVFQAADRLCTSELATERELGATIIGQLGIPDRTFPGKSFLCLARMLQTETDPDTLQAIAVGFSHLNNPRCIELLTPLKSHPASIVRWGVAHGISRHNDPVAIQTLIELSADEDEEIRDWATFGLGSLIDTDTQEIRDALWARVTDTYDDARAEALTGLARRKDPRVVELLLRELDAEQVDIMIIDAAEQFADPALLPALMKLKVRWPLERIEDEQWLDNAIQSCSGLAKESSENSL
jgi:HEAT repeat protein